MSKRIQIIDYGLGNLFSIQQACESLGAEAIVSSAVDEFGAVDGIILPGVGAFGNAIEKLRELNIVEPLKEAVNAGKPLMGICLGMQLLFDESEEFGQHEGLGLLPGKIRRIPDQTENEQKLRVPNVGWNPADFTVEATSSAILHGIASGTYFYFVHSYYCEPSQTTDWLLQTQYGKICYCCAAQRDNILGLQFHPEKSGKLGLRLYHNWLETL